MNVRVQFEVVLPPEELLAYLTLEPATTAVGGQVTPQVPFTRKHLGDQKELVPAQTHGEGTEGPSFPAPFWPLGPGPTVSGPA